MLPKTMCILIDYKIQTYEKYTNDNNSSDQYDNCMESMFTNIQ